MRLAVNESFSRLVRYSERAAIGDRCNIGGQNYTAARAVANYLLFLMRVKETTQRTQYPHPF